MLAFATGVALILGVVLMNSRTVLSLVSTGLLVATAAAVQPAWAAPPPNDNRADAISVDPPRELKGTLVDATLESGTDSSNCAGTDASVWYRFVAPKRGAIIIQLDAAGEMDATIDLYRQNRSKYQYVECDETDSKGVATIDNESLEPGGTYAIRVGKEFGSVAESFTLRVLVPSPAPEPPGKKLPAKGVKNSVDRLVNPGDAYHAFMREGRTMRLSLRVQQCTSLDVFGPGTTGFGGTPVKRLSCGGYTLFTPTESGRHFLVVRAGKSRDKQSYRLRIATANRDDTTPGIFIRNDAKVSGKVNGGIDFRDLYRFDVTRRSTLTLSVSGGPTMRLVRENGSGVGRGDFIDRTVSAGRYYVAVQGEGKYTLKRVSRTITNTSVRVNGRRSVTVSPGASVQLSLNVRPAVAGRGTMIVERFDPIDGWQFARRYPVSVDSGRGSATFSPPSVGRYRVFGEYKGTRIAAPSDANSVVRFKVQQPLSD
jgi:hypothetical protein